MAKIIFTFSAVIVILLIAFWGYNYFNFLKTEEAGNNTQNSAGTRLNTPTSSFKGPIDTPSVKGPSGPPPNSSY